MYSSRRLLATSSSSGRGALGGGFSKDNLTEWAAREWGEVAEPGHYIDLHSHKISPECAAVLERHSRPSTAMSRAFFGSSVFAPERFLVSTLGFSKNDILPSVFRKGDSYLFFTATESTPHELILGWKLGQSRGCTMLAVDPRARLVYLGSGIEKADYHRGVLFRKILTPFHIFYSNLLIKGMVKELEDECAKLESPGSG
ncbi:expressed unknown protein [Seminavis robusta]|uniref:Uncharacterized protein n=1 Tax=Seminavis robusta TaxID=568900 RepID=A0A9N8ESQ4_9STRA|nr:expressed unknown protein [Seminavis robusta]|eukprot:Sro1486_g276640.1 n/a (200) ;mRNA; r:15627-16226